MPSPDKPHPLLRVEREVIACRRCPRLRRHSEEVSRTKKLAFRDELYWAKPVPGFGDSRAWLLLVGLAPAAHGANRTGRMFTGDGSDGMGASDFLMRALHKAGHASRPDSRHRGDGLEVRGAFLTAIVRCAPPANRPLRQEIDRCESYLLAEMEALREVRVVLTLGREAFEQVLRIFARHGAPVPRPRPRFRHGAEFHPPVDLPVLLASYHPSRQNTQTGRLSTEMLDAILGRARELRAERS